MSTHRTRATQGRGAIVVFALSALLPLLAPAPLQAQARSGTVNTIAQVLPPPVTGSGIQELAFGSARPGDVVDVPPGAAAIGAATSSAGWRFTGVRKGHLVALDLTLPPFLTLGADAIPVDWDNAGYGTICVANSSGTCLVGASFNPGTSPTQSINLTNAMSGNNFDLWLYAGARLTVPGPIPRGLYTAVVVAVFSYVS
jgi:hypothetical protein